MSGSRWMVRGVAVVGVAVLVGCSGGTAAPVVTTVVSTTTPLTTSTTTTTTTSTTSTSTTTLDPVVAATAAVRASWEQYRANILLCKAAYPNCDVEALLVPFLTSPDKERTVDSYAKSQADAKAIGAIWVQLELDTTTFEGAEFENSELTEAILTYCGVYGSRKVIPATLTTPEVIIDDEIDVTRTEVLMVLEADGVWRLKDNPSMSVDFDGMETCPPEN
jgi:ABC-type transport system substrate-binding protein